MASKTLPLVHPGEILLEEFLKPLGITRYRLAKSIQVPQRRIDEICSGKRGITADTALRLARFFGTDAQSWINLQTHYDLEKTAAEVTDILKKIEPMEKQARAA
ncbi:MAG: HigA family addiction module antitoxin [Desulfobulbaceae bacterium]